MATRILVADDHKIMRDGLRVLFAGETDLEIVGEAADGEDAVAKTAQLHPDVVVMDITLPVLDGVAATSRITALHPHVRVIGLSMHRDRYFVDRMRAVGAAGYVLKDEAFDFLAQAIRKVVGGETYFPA